MRYEEEERMRNLSRFGVPATDAEMARVAAPIGTVLLRFVAAIALGIVFAMIIGKVHL